MANNSSKSLSFGKASYETLAEGRGVSAATYNLIMGGMVLYGIVINIIMCMTCTEFALSINPIVMLVGYLVLVLAGTFIIHRAKSSVIRFVAYNMIVVPLGLVLSIVVQSYGGVDLRRSGSSSCAAGVPVHRYHYRRYGHAQHCFPEVLQQDRRNAFWLPDRYDPRLSDCMAHGHQYDHHRLFRSCAVQPLHRIRLLEVPAACAYGRKRDLVSMRDLCGHGQPVHQTS